MKIVVDDRSGFCPGVVKAIEKAESHLLAAGKLFSLGDIMHNKVEMSRLCQMGLVPIQHSEIESIAGATLLIRAHGEPPITYQRCKNNQITVIDATCSVVARLQKIVAAAYLQMKAVGGQVVILGKHGHPEVIGLLGQVVDGSGIVVDSIDEINSKIDFSKPIFFLSQTTKSLSLFEEACALIQSRYNLTPHLQCVIKDTICRQVSNRKPHLEQFAARFDVIIFVSGAESSNGKALFETCCSVNPNSYKIEDSSQLKPEWFASADSVGVCGATSTPRWLMDCISRDIATL